MKLPVRRPSLECLEGRTAPAVLHVAVTGSDAAGGSAADPLRTIQAAVNRAASGDEIRVAGGTYAHEPAADLVGGSLGTTAAVVVNDKVLTLLGGFSTDDAFAERDLVNSPTVIDGQNQFRGILVIDIEGAPAPTGLTLDGFTVRNGLASPIPQRGGLDTIYAFGGGLFVDGGTAAGPDVPVTVTNVTFENNVVRGGDNTTQVFAGQGGVIGGNAAGGGAALRFTRSTSFDNVIFAGNQALGGVGGNRGGAALGAGIHINESDFTADNVTFVGNVNRGGDTAGNGTDDIGEEADALGAALAVQVNASATLTDITAEDNQSLGGASTGGASQGGGAFGGALFSELANLTVRDAVIRGNLAAAGPGFNGGVAGGGAVQSSESNVTLDRVQIVENVSQGGDSTGEAGGAGPVGGGGIYLTQFFTPAAQAAVTNSLIAENRVQFGTGPGNRNAGGGGGGVWLQGMPASITHTTIAGNELGPDLVFGDAVLLISDATTPAPLDLSHSVIADHTSGQSSGALFVRTPETVNINNLLYANNADDDNRDGSGNAPFAPGAFNGQGSIVTAADAGFADPAALDYALVGSSAAVDAAAGSATPADIAQAPRDGSPDLGAYELGTAGGPLPGSGATGAMNPDASSPPPPPSPVGPAQTLLATGPAGSAVAAYSLESGTADLLTTLTAFAGSASEARAAAGDLNGDGVADYVLGEGPGGSRVRAVDGVTGGDLVAPFNSFEDSFTGGVFVATGDIDGDGRWEFAVSPDVGGGGRVQIFSLGADGSLAQRDNFFGIDDPDFRGGARASIGDLDGDGLAELVVGAGFGGGPRVAVFDGRSLLANGPSPLRLIGDFFAFPGADAVNLRNGVFVAAGNFGGSADADLAFGGGPGGAPRVFVLDGSRVLSDVGDAQNNPLANFFADDAASRGGARVAAKDSDGDGAFEVAVGSGEGRPATVRLFDGSGASGGQFVAFGGVPPAGIFVG